MKYFDDMKDNDENVDNYAGYDDVVDNQDPDDLVRIAHEINDCVDPIPATTDVGNVAAEFRERCYSMIREDYSYLDPDQVAEVMQIIEENYMEEDY